MSEEKSFTPAKATIHTHGERLGLPKIRPTFATNL
jgi:hypothetical protein